MAGLFTHVDCVELYVSDLDEGIAYYRDALGLKLLWRRDTSAGLGLENDIAEVVLQTERQEMNVDFKVDSVDEAVGHIARAGGTVLHGPFDIPIGKCAVVTDKWHNRYVILDMTKGRFVTDEQGNVLGVQ